MCNGEASAALNGQVKPVSVVSASCDKETVVVHFSDGAGFLFHALWLLDAAPEVLDLRNTGERVIERSPLVHYGGSYEEMVKEASAAYVEAGNLVVQWAPGASLERAVFPAHWLRTYARMAGKPVEGTAVDEPVPEDFFQYLESSKAPDPKSLQLWDASAELPRMSYDEIAGSAQGHLRFLEKLMNPGIVIVEGMPEDEAKDAAVLHAFAQEFLGGLQKHPLRATANWTISTEELSSKDFLSSTGTVKDRSGYGGVVEERQTRAYNTDQQLQQHTDQSAYSAPGLLLLFHCADGQGGNTVTDGFKVAYTMKEQHPEEWAAITQLGYNLGRRVEHYKMGVQMQIESEPAVVLDEDGNVRQIRYHELYRSALQLPFDEFPKYFKAISLFYKLVHSPENMKPILLRKGELLAMNNWRTMHGRAGLAGKRRTIIGGTVAKPGFLSAVRTIKEKMHGLSICDTLGTPLSHFNILAKEMSTAAQADQAAEEAAEVPPVAAPMVPTPEAVPVA